MKNSKKTNPDHSDATERDLDVMQVGRMLQGLN
ncbi:hypothetical protein EV144_101800 [Flavobacterium sp. 270]|nr:hypothetical protein EV145_106165 [Flavobacterium sp. 245]TDW52117.1 hypothetical protein EV144_101800 [Flavobacterium sp. 270]